MITEKEIFDFVFFPSALPEEKQVYIRDNAGLSAHINFYEELKSQLQQRAERSFKKIIASKIPAYKLVNEVELNGFENNAGNGGKLRLAAASREFVPQLTTQTFIDEEKEYLVKILTDKTQTKIFVFSTQNSTLKNFRIIIEPTHLEFQMADNSEPLLINKPITAERIKINFAD